MASPTKRDRGTEPTPNRDGAQYIEEKGEERLVKNSPYGTTRQSYGWGSPFQKPRKAVSTRYPNVRIGASSLNGTPGKDRSMDKLLQQYQKKFTVLEHCNPYHRMGEVEQWEKWAGMVAADFVYTVKCNQYLTHMRMLEMDADLQAHIEHFFVDRIPKMKNKFGAALVQLPPQFRATPENRDRLRAFAAQVPTSVRVAVEFRHASWFTDETYDILRATKWALVATHNFDVGDSPIVDTGAGFMYCRLHGSVAQYCGDYGLEGMRRWAAVIRNFVANNGPDAPVYIFLNNNESHAGHLTSSVVDATALATILDTEDTAPAPSAVTAAGAGVAAASTSGVASAAAAAESATPPTAAAGASPARAATQPTQQSKGTAADPEEISTQSEDGSAIEVA